MKNGAWAGCGEREWGKTGKTKEIYSIVHKLMALSQDQTERPKRMILRFTSRYLYLGCDHSHCSTDQIFLGHLT